MLKKILHGLDGSKGSLNALKEAIFIAKSTGAALHTISIEELPRYPGTTGEFIEEKKACEGQYVEAVNRALEMAAGNGITVEPHVFEGHEVKSIVDFIKTERFDLLVIGFMGHSAIYDRIMGSTCQSLVRLAPCSVLVVK